MDDHQKTELLSTLLHTLFGPQLKGKYIVEYRGSITVNADDKHDAIEKVKDIIKNDPSQVNFMATRLEDLVPEELAE